MTSFVHVDQPATHPGVERAEAAIAHLRAAGRGFDSARGLAALLLAAIVSALLIAADRVMSSWTEGGLLLAWLVLWAVAFAALALFAGSTRGLAARLVLASRAAARRRAAARADEAFMAMARQDPRILRDLQAVATREEAVAEPAPVSPAAARVARRSEQVRMPTLYEAMRRVNLGQYY